MSRRYFLGFITNHINLSSHSKSPCLEKGPKKPKNNNFWKYKNKERWKQTSNYYYNVENFHQLGPVIKAKWMDARKVPKIQTQGKHEHKECQNTTKIGVKIDDQNPEKNTEEKGKAQKSRRTKKLKT